MYHIFVTNNQLLAIMKYDHIVCETKEELLKYVKNNLYKKMFIFKDEDKVKVDINVSLIEK